MKVQHFGRQSRKRRKNRDGAQRSLDSMRAPSKPEQTAYAASSQHSSVAGTTAGRIRGLRLNPVSLTLGRNANPSMKIVRLRFRRSNRDGQNARGFDESGVILILAAFRQMNEG